MVLRFAALPLRHWMGVVEPDQPLAVWPVQRQRVVDAVRLLRRHRHWRHDEPDPMTALRVHHENLPVEVEKHIEGRVTRLRHGIVIILKQHNQGRGLRGLPDRRVALGVLISLIF